MHSCHAPTCTLDASRWSQIQDPITQFPNDVVVRLQSKNVFNIHDRRPFEALNHFACNPRTRIIDRDWGFYVYREGAKDLVRLMGGLRLIAASFEAIIALRRRVPCAHTNSLFLILKRRFTPIVLHPLIHDLDESEARILQQVGITGFEPGFFSQRLACVHPERPSEVARSSQMI